jgi:pyrroline-5-carboxylate reductase
MNSGNCPEGKIYNAKTKRCVLITGKIGQQILKELQQSKKTKVPKVPVKQPKQEKQKKRKSSES